MRKCEQCRAGVGKKRRFCDACNTARCRARTRENERRRRQDPTYRARQADFQRLKRLDPREAQLHAERSSRWARENRDLVRANTRRWISRCLDGQSPGVTVEQWYGILTYFGGRCAYCLRNGLPLERDHVIPLKRGGLDEPGNVVPACKSCNCSKNAAILPLWYARALNEKRMQ